MKRSASAVWRGGVREGHGQISTESGVLRDKDYSYGKRFGEDSGTNPEELVAAAHAACFSMALAAQLSDLHIEPEELQTTATVTMERDEKGWSITESALHVVGRATKATEAIFEAAASKAQTSCPISKLLNTHITLKTEFHKS